MNKGKSLFMISVSLALYVFVVIFFYQKIGDLVTAFAVFSIVLSAWNFGKAGGLIAGVIISILTVSLLVFLGVFDSKIVAQFIVRSSAGIFIGFVLGYSREESIKIGKLEQETVALKLGVDKTKDIIFITDSEGIITYANPAFTETYGFTQADWKGKTPRILKSGNTSKEFYDNLWTNLKAGKHMDYELINKTKSGKLLAMQASANPIISKDGKLLGYMAIQRDITEQKQTQNELAKQTNDLQKLNDLMVGRENKMAEMKVKFKNANI